MMFIVLAAFFTTLIFVCFEEGWRKGLLILGISFVSYISINFITFIIGIGIGYRLVINQLVIGIWTIGLILYCIFNEYVKNI